MISSKFAFAAFVGILILTALIHFAFLPSTPWDWDEPVYTEIAQNTQEVGHPALGFSDEQPDWYPFHPPFHFYLLSSWFSLIDEESITAARIWSSLVSVLAVALTMVLIKSVYSRWEPALLAGGLIALDGWFNYSSLLVKLDTSALTITVVGMIALCWSLRNPSTFSAVMTGTLLGLSAIYKHVAVAGVIAVLVHLVMTRWLIRHHFIILFAACSVIAAYVVGMSLIVGEPYTHATTVQIKRSLGMQEARGLDYGISEVLKALLQTYWAYVGTLLALTFSGLLALWQGWRISFPKQEDVPSVLVSWVLAAAAILAGVKLRNPHYLVYLIVPSLALFATYLWHLWLQGGKGRTVAIGLVAVLVVLNMTTLAIRATRFSGTNALQEIDATLDRLPADAVLVAEEPICALAEQTCYKIGTVQSAERLEAADPDYVIVYTSITQRPPDSPALLELLSGGEEVYSVRGWKETITILDVQSVR